MKKILFTLTGLLLLIGFNVQAQSAMRLASTNEQNDSKMSNSIYQFKVTDLNGKEFDFAKLAGKKILIVNTASKCGLTPQYEDLQKLYKKYNDKNFVIVGFPTNDFNEQEPGSDAEIAAFCQKNYGVSFPMMSKITLSGEFAAPIYEYLTQQSKNGVKDSVVKWNFQKYLINEKGQLDQVISSEVSPLNEAIINRINN